MSADSSGSRLPVGSSASRMCGRGAEARASALIVAGNGLKRCKAAYFAATAGYDAVLMPTAANLPPDHERLLSDAEYYVTENLLTLRNTRIGNLMGGCGMSLPTGVPSCGMQMLAPPMTEPTANSENDQE